MGADTYLAVRDRRIVACPECGMRQLVDTAAAVLRSHRRRPWDVGCSGSGRPGLNLGPESWFRHTRFGGLHLIDGDPFATELILCRGCHDVFRIPRPTFGAFDRTTRVYVTCNLCDDCFPLGSLRRGPRGMWVPREPLRLEQSDEALVEYLV